MVEMDNYGFFDYRSGDGDKYKYTAEEFAKILSFIIGNGVPKGTGKQLDLAANPTSTELRLSTGAVWINGHCGWLINGATVALTPSTVNRKDYIVARLDNENRRIVIEQKIGTTNVPTLTENETPLYRLDWTAGSSTPVANDERPFLYLSGGMPQQQVVFSSAVPSNPSEGMIWLRPV